MSQNTPRLNVPYLVQSQGQKELTHNQALNVYDAFIQTAVESAGAATPPTTPVEGNLYIVGTSATGAWAGQDNNLAQYIGSAWQFYVPLAEMRAWDKNQTVPLVWHGGHWINELSASNKVGFFGAAAVTKPTVTGSKGGNAALSSLIAQLANLGLITDSTT